MCACVCVQDLLAGLMCQCTGVRSCEWGVLRGMCPPLAILWAPTLVVATGQKYVVSYIAHVYSKDHLVVSMADFGMEAHAVHTLFPVRYDKLWSLFATQDCCVAWWCRCVTR